MTTVNNDYGHTIGVNGVLVESVVGRIIGGAGKKGAFYVMIVKECINVQSLALFNRDLPIPTVLRIGPYRFYFYSHEPNEPPHIHVDRDNLSAKFWLQLVELARNRGFSSKELGRIRKLIIQYQAEFLEAWDEHLGGHR